MTTVLEIAGPLLVCGWFFAAFVDTFCTPEPAEPADETEARMELAIAAETHPGRRAALTIARHQHNLEER